MMYSKLNKMLLDARSAHGVKTKALNSEVERFSFFCQALSSWDYGITDPTNAIFRHKIVLSGIKVSFVRVENGDFLF